MLLYDVIGCCSVASRTLVRVMKLRTAILAFVLLAAASCTPAPDSGQALAPLEGFDWLAGCWLSRDGVVERWELTIGSAISGSTLIPDVDGAQVGQSLRITTTESGGVSFLAQIADQPVRVFSLVRKSEFQVVFETERGADVRKITYRREGDSLFVVLQAGEEQVWETRYVPCASGGSEQAY